MATEKPAPEPQDLPAEASPERLKLWALAEAEAARLSALMGPEWAAGMYD